MSKTNTNTAAVKMVDARVKLRTLAEIESKEAVLDLFYNESLASVDVVELAGRGLEALQTKLIPSLVIKAIDENFYVLDDNDAVLGSIPATKLLLGDEPWAKTIKAFDSTKEADYLQCCSSSKVFPLKNIKKMEASIVEEINAQKVEQDATKVAEAFEKESPKGFKEFVKELSGVSAESGFEKLKMRIFILNKFKDNKYADLVEIMNSYAAKKMSKDNKGFKKVIGLFMGFFVKVAQVLLGVTLFAFDFSIIIACFTGRMVKHLYDELKIAGKRTGNAFSNDILSIFTETEVKDMFAL